MVFMLMFPLCHPTPDGCRNHQALGLQRFGLEDFSQGAQDSIDVALIGAFAHQPDAPGLALKLAQPGADFDAKLVHQALAANGLVISSRCEHGAQRGRLMLRIRDVLQAQPFQPRI